MSEALYMKIKFLCILVWAILGLALSTASWAQEENKPFIRNQRLIVDPVPLNLEQITLFADRVFTGIPVKREKKIDSNTNIPIVEYTFKITEVIKDSQKKISNKNHVVFRQWKPITGDVDFNSNKKYVVFLNPNSKIGLTSTVGLWQGQFEVEEQKINGTRIEFVKNRLSNKGLGRNLKTQQKISIEEDKVLNDYILRSSEAGQPIKYREFVKSIKAIEKKNRRRS